MTEKDIANQMKADAFLLGIDLWMMTEDFIKDGRFWVRIFEVTRLFKSEKIKLWINQNGITGKDILKKICSLYG